MKILEIKNLHKSFGKTHVLKGVDFSMEEGEVLSVIGSSGSGKTTLLRCINFLETADKGQILLDGNVIFDGEHENKLTAEEIRKRQLNFGLVFQNFNLFPQYTAFDNITLAPLMRLKEQKPTKEVAHTTGIKRITVKRRAKILFLRKLWFKTQHILYGVFWNYLSGSGTNFTRNSLVNW